MSTTTEYPITGMTCAHCEGAVKSELKQLAGVESVDVSASRGSALVTSANELDVDAVRSAVDNAGYELASS